MFLHRYKFKARELNHKIFEGGPLLPKKPTVKELTQPIGFQLEIEKRIQERESKKQQEEEHFEFHSRPCPKKILEDVVVRSLITLRLGNWTSGGSELQNVCSYVVLCV